MPKFIEFPREQARGSREGPRFTLQARGLLSLNHAAFVALGEPEAVALLYDPEEHIVALRKVSRTYKNAYQVRKQRQAQTYVVGAQAFTVSHGIPTPRARRYAGVDYGDNVWGFALSEGLDVKNLRGTPEPPRPQTSRWRHTTDGFEVPALMRITHKAFNHMGFLRSPEKTPPSVRIGALVACDPLGPTPSTSDLGSRFLGFLTRQPVLDLVSMMTHIDSAASWRRMAGNGRLMLEAAMMTEDQQEVPVAAAMLLLPQPGASHFGSDPRCAELVLHIEPRNAEGSPAAAAGLKEWRDRFARTLAVPGQLADFLTHELNLAAGAEPPAQLGVFLNAHRSIAELVDPGGLRSLPGSAQSNQFIGFAIADPDGKPFEAAADDLVGQLCDFTLHLENWETVLASQ
jgi:hypothetical protein